MKILRLTTLLDFGGQEKQYLSLTDYPHLLHNQYVFAAIGHGGYVEKVLRKRGFEVHIINRNFTIKNLSNIWFVYKLIKKVKPDVVHTAAAEANFHGIIAAKLAGVKTIIGEEIGIPNHSFVAQKTFQVIYTLADKVICVSQSVKDYLVKTGEIKKKKGIVVYNPVSFPKPFPIEKKNGFDIVYVGRLEKVKNVETLIRAFYQLSDKSITLIIVGDGRERHKLENLVKELQLENQIIFKGFQSNPSQFLSEADLFVLPSFSEGFGIAAVEAMLLKIPVLATQVGGIPEFIRHNDNGWLFNPNSIEDLVEKLKHILKYTNGQRLRIGEQGYLDVKSIFTIENYIKCIETVYA